MWALLDLSFPLLRLIWAGARTKCFTALALISQQVGFIIQTKAQSSYSMQIDLDLFDSPVLLEQMLMASVES